MIIVEMKFSDGRKRLFFGPFSSLTEAKHFTSTREDWSECNHVKLQTP